MFFGNTITVLSSGSALGDRVISQNFVGGNGNTLNQISSGSGINILVNTMLFGNGLIASGSNNGLGTGGTAIVGRYNATGSNQETTNETVFVVGTGTAANARRNALHIDSNNNTRITGSVSISGSLTVNGSTVGSTVGFITTGSLTSDQTIGGQLRISGSDTQSLQVGSGQNTAKIAVYNSNNPFLYHNTSNYNSILGNVEGATNGFTTGSQKNMLFTGFYLGFNSGSQNTIIAGGGGANFRSGSNNTIIGGVGNLQFGNNNTYIGTPGPNTLEDNTIRIGRPGLELLVKSGSNATQINGDVQITGSLNVTGGITGSIDKTGLITTGSFGTTQSISGSLILNNVTGNTLIVSGGFIDPDTGEITPSFRAQGVFQLDDITYSVGPDTYTVPSP